MKLSHVLHNFLTNKIVLNIVCVLSAFNMIGYLVLGKLAAILFFIILAILITQFSKNMIIVLGVPLILVNLLVITGGFNRIEGFEDKGKDKKPDTKIDASKPDVNRTDSSKMDVSKPDPSRTDASKPDPSRTDPSRTDASKRDTSRTDTIKRDNRQKQNDKGIDNSNEVGRAKRKGAGNQIDYASTVEDAYDELSNILGGDGIKKLTDDTERLMKQQMNLAESMSAMGPMIKNLEPMMKQAEGLLGSMQSGDGEGGLASIMEMAKKFGVNKS